MFQVMVFVPCPFTGYDYWPWWYVSTRERLPACFAVNIQSDDT
jgi:hypothetical protein